MHQQIADRPRRTRRGPSVGSNNFGSSHPDSVSTRLWPSRLAPHRQRAEGVAGDASGAWTAASEPWNPRGKEEFSETSSHTLRARALGRACRAGEPTRSRWENKIFYLKRHGTLTNEDDLLRWSALVCTLRCIGQRYLLQVRSLTPLSPARCTDSGTLPRSLRGTLCRVGSWRPCSRDGFSCEVHEGRSCLMVRVRRRRTFQLRRVPLPQRSLQRPGINMDLDD